MGFIITLFVGTILGFVIEIFGFQLLKGGKKLTSIYVITIISVVLTLILGWFITTKSLYYLLTYALGIGVGLSPILTTIKEEQVKEEKE